MKYLNKSSQYLLSGLVITILLSGLVLSSTFVSADDVVDEINITVPISCTLGGTGMDTHNATINNGQYNSAIGESTIKAFCNDSEGFAIYAVGFTDDEPGKNVLSNSTLGSTFDISTGTLTAGNASQWAMKLSTITSPVPTYPIIIAGSNADTDKEQGDPDFTSFQEVPDDYTLVAKRTAGTDIGQSAEGATIKSTYQAYISPTQPAGTYTGQVKYTLVHPNDADPISPEPITCPQYEVCYSPNAHNALGTMGTTSDVEFDWDSDEVEITPLPSNFSRKGYGFAGWNDKYDYSGTTYGPTESFRIPTNEFFKDTGLSLYAIWVKSAGYLQNWQGCPSLSQGQVTALTDQRNNETYTVAKLADGKCWMIENLRLDDSMDLTPQNTNNPSLPLRILNTDGSISTANRLSPSFVESSTSAHMYLSDNTQEDWALSILYTGATTNRSTSPSSVINTKFYSYGNYYNWYSATAANDKNDEKINNESTEGDICPTGWRLPIGGDTNNALNNDFARLDIALGGTGTASNSYTNPTSSTMASRYKAYPNNFIYSETYSGEDFTNWPSESGHYWTSTTGDNLARGYELLINNNFIYPGTYAANKGEGNSIRCLIAN